MGYICPGHCGLNHWNKRRVTSSISLNWHTELYLSYQLARCLKEGKRQGWCVCLKVEMSTMSNQWLVGIKALINKDNNMLLSDLKTGKAYFIIIFLIYLYHNFPNIFFIIIFLIYPNYHYINANYILSQEATLFWLWWEPCRAEYGCGYPVKRLFELLEI